ncbi:MAG TPA: YCF48-related protein [Candidatus Acidoferrales bacterium]
MRTRSLTQLSVILFTLCSIAGIIPIRVLAQTKNSTAQKPGGANLRKFKGYFEPVNYPEDVEISDVWFVNADTGWACGDLKATAAEEGGFIINTRDGGKTWKLQMGDPHSATRGVAKLFFLDATHGWATQNGSKLLRTTDGENWETVGNGSPGWALAFVSPQIGFHIEGERLLMTTDGGTSWKEHYQCQAKVEVDGLPHDETCHLQAIAFPTPTVGYAVSSEVSDKSSVVVKTTDGGKTWNVASFIPQSTGLDNSLGFADENTGFVMTYQSKLMATNDGAKTWHGVATSIPGGRPRIEFANPTGWTIEGKTWAYTTDGGKHWTSREVAFPADVVAFSLARSDRGYVVGDHGMIYRYSVVPAEYSVPHGINAPVMPGGNSEGKP